MRIKKAVRHFKGVEDVKANMSANELTVIGKVDSVMLRDKLVKKTRKKIDIVSHPKKEDGAAEESPEKKSEKNEPKKITVVLKTGMICVCDGCIQKVQKLILKVKAESASFAGNKELVTVEGTMVAEDLVSYMNKKLKRKVEVVQPKKEENNEVKGESGEKENKEEENGSGEMEGEVDVIKIDGFDCGYNGHFMYRQNNNGYVNEGQESPVPSNEGSRVEQFPFIMLPQIYPHPQMFSDENPNACSVM
ncbi:putative heavy metal-associated domain, HMA [Lupinus albus]|uniref:Putative heavy metal-associated domain, HMA n=1 Tax=Lupinus albus TaxID=3870 RepID=A0A6A4R4I9_LUPAL|nr:putative heavy metal-associated domain, HMA [Lupinus albus]